MLNLMKPVNSTGLQAHRATAALYRLPRVTHAAVQETRGSLPIQNLLPGDMMINGR